MTTIGTQTRSVSFVDAQTETEPNDEVEEGIEINENGEIRPKPDQSILEFKISHDFKSWDEVKSEICENYKLRIIGNPWLANNECLFKTVAFVTPTKCYEKWKNKT